jgi:hypothetical protein
MNFMSAIVDLESSFDAWRDDLRVVLNSGDAGVEAGVSPATIPKAAGTAASTPT